MHGVNNNVNSEISAFTEKIRNPEDKNKPTKCTN